MKNYYNQLDKWIKRHERGNGDVDTYQIVNKIDWCWKWKKITWQQLTELVDRMNKLYRGD